MKVGLLCIKRVYHDIIETVNLFIGMRAKEWVMSDLGEVVGDIFSTVREYCTFDIYFEIFITVSCFISILVGHWMSETDVQRLFRTLQPDSIAWERAVTENDGGSQHNIE